MASRSEYFEIMVLKGPDLDPFVPDEEPVAVVVRWVEVEVVHQLPSISNVFGSPDQVQPTSS